MKLSLRAESRLQLGLIALATALAIWTIADVLIDYEADTSTPPAASGSPGATAAPAESSTVLEDYAVIVERPLFFETRRPYEPAQISETGPTENVQTPGLVLSAVIMADDLRIAIVESGRNEVQRLQPGESIHGWTLTGVEAQRAMFTRGTETLMLELTVPASGPATIRQSESRSPAPTPGTAAPAGEPSPASPQTDDKSPS